MLEFCGIRSLAAQKGIGNTIDRSFLRSVRQPGSVKSFSIRIQKQWGSEMPVVLMERVIFCKVWLFASNYMPYFDFFVIISRYVY